MATQIRNLEVGEAAPPIECTDEQGHRHRSWEYRGQTLVLCFIPVQGPGFGTHDFAESYPGTSTKDIFLLGVMRGTPHSVGEFKRHARMPFPMLCDADGSVEAAYGMAQTMAKGANMAFVAIGPDGRVQLVLKHARNPRHVYELLGRARPKKRM